MGPGLGRHLWTFLSRRVDAGVASPRAVGEWGLAYLAGCLLASASQGKTRQGQTRQGQAGQGKAMDEDGRGGGRDNVTGGPRPLVSGLTGCLGGSRRAEGEKRGIASSCRHGVEGEARREECSVCGSKPADVAGPSRPSPMAPLEGSSRRAGRSLAERTSLAGGAPITYRKEQTPAEFARNKAFLRSILDRSCLATLHRMTLIRTYGLNITC